MKLTENDLRTIDRMLKREIKEEQDKVDHNIKLDERLKRLRNLRCRIVADYTRLMKSLAT